MKNILSLKWGGAVAVVMLVCASPLMAQMFEDSASESSQPTPANNNPNKRNFNNDWLSNPRAVPTANKPMVETPKKQEVKTEKPQLSVDKSGAQKALEAKQNAVRELTKSLEGKRGYSAMNQVVGKGEKQPEDDRLIFLFYKDFNISKTMSGLVMCDVKFIILTTLDSKVSNISFRLKWPSIETSLSFNDIEPNVETYFNYTLVGDGCYSMDKIPNVIVNRCRAKGLSQRECANKIRWLKK